MRRIVLILAVCSVSTLLFAQQFDPALYQELRWRCIDPFRAGRTVAVAGVPSQPNVFYMAPVNSDVWKSTDYGEVWTPIFDDQPTQSVNAITITPSNTNIIYIGNSKNIQHPNL